MHVLLQSGFFIKFQIQSEWITLPKIRLVDEKNAARHTSYYLPDEGSIIIIEKIIANNHYVKLCLTSANENSTRIISIQPYYVICNFSKYQLSYYAFCIHRSEKFTHNDIVKLLTERASPIPIMTNHPTADNM